MTETATAINNAAELPSDGMITVRRWDRQRRQGFHVEKILTDHDDMVTVIATPVNISTGRTNGEPRSLLLAFGLNEIEVMP